MLKLIFARVLRVHSLCTITLILVIVVHLIPDRRLCVVRGAFSSNIIRLRSAVHISSHLVMDTLVWARSILHDNYMKHIHSLVSDSESYILEDTRDTVSRTLWLRIGHYIVIRQGLVLRTVVFCIKRYSWQRCTFNDYNGKLSRGTSGNAINEISK